MSDSSTLLTTSTAPPPNIPNKQRRQGEAENVRGGRVEGGEGGIPNLDGALLRRFLYCRRPRPWSQLTSRRMRHGWVLSSLAGSVVFRFKMKKSFGPFFSIESKLCDKSPSLLFFKRLCGTAFPSQRRVLTFPSPLLVVAWTRLCLRPRPTAHGPSQKY